MNELLPRDKLRNTNVEMSSRHIVGTRNMARAPYTAPPTKHSATPTPTIHQELSSPL